MAAHVRTVFIWGKPVIHIQHKLAKETTCEGQWNQGLSGKVQARQAHFNTNTHIMYTQTLEIVIVRLRGW